MKTTTLTRILATVVLAGSLVSPASALTSSAASSILFMKQEEKLARDVYQTLAAKWGHYTFVHIMASEQQHMNAVDRLISIYQLTDPTPAEPGKFTYPELQTLYNDLVAAGSKSLRDALAVGVAIEQTDIADLQEALKSTRERPVWNVFNSLMRASSNHLAAFNRALR